MPTIIVLDWSVALRTIGPITFFPSFYRPGYALQVCREAVMSRMKFPEWDHKLSLDLLGISEENIGFGYRDGGSDGGLPAGRLSTSDLHKFKGYHPRRLHTQLFRYILAFINR